MRITKRCAENVAERSKYHHFTQDLWSLHLSYIISENNWYQNKSIWVWGFGNLVSLSVCSLNVVHVDDDCFMSLECVCICAHSGSLFLHFAPTINIAVIIYDYDHIKPMMMLTGYKVTIIIILLLISWVYMFKILVAHNRKVHITLHTLHTSIYVYSVYKNHIFILSFCPILMFSLVLIFLFIFSFIKFKTPFNFAHSLSIHTHTHTRIKFMSLLFSNCRWETLYNYYYY